MDLNRDGHVGGGGHAGGGSHVGRGGPAGGGGYVGGGGHAGRGGYVGGGGITGQAETATHMDINRDGVIGGHKAPGGGGMYTILFL